MTRSRNKAKTAKKAGVEAEAKREAAGVVRPGAKTPGKAGAKAGSQADSVAICLHADFCNKDYFLVGQGCGLCVSLVGVEGCCRTRQGFLS